MVDFAGVPDFSPSRIAKPGPKGFPLEKFQPGAVGGASGKPAPYGSVGVYINCAVIGFTAGPPTANLERPAPNSQFPPR